MTGGITLRFAMWGKAACLLAALAVFALATGPSAMAHRPAAAKGAHPGKTRFTPQELETLVGSLERMGFKREEIEQVFYDERLRKLDRVVSYNAVNPETRDRYAHFTSPFALRMARRFLARHRAELERVERTYNVSKEVITAILLVETRFGRARLRYRVLEVFTTLVVESNPDSVQRHYARLKARHPDIEKEWLTERLVKKAEFAMGELVAMLSMFRENLRHMYEVRGSYAGAIGIPQFLPSSYLRWAVDGNEDGNVDLNDLSDAVPSVANFLRFHGWHPQAHFRTNWHAVWEYNNSDQYVRVIHEIAYRLTIPSKRRG